MNSTQRRLEVLPIRKESFVIVLPAGHRLSSKDVFQPSDVQDEDFLAYGRMWAPNFFDRWVQIFEQAGVNPRIVQETGEMSTLLALVAAGLGIAVVPRGLAEKGGQAVTVRKLPPQSPLSEIGFAFRSGHDNSLLRKLCSLARSMGRSYQQD